MSLDISQMMDGELDEDAARRLLASLRDDDQARTTWEQYHIIGDALRGTAGVPGRHALQQRVFAALAQEPTVLAPPARRALPARWPRYSVAAAATALAAFGLISWLSPLEAPMQQLASQQQQWQRDPAPLDMPSSNAEDPYVEAHFEVSPAIRPSVMRVGWQPDEQR